MRLLRATVAFLLLAWISPSTLLAGVTQCGNRRATIVGTGGDDVLAGTPGQDVIAGRAGDDRINGRGGNDFLCGGAGRDVILGGDGQDFLFGASGADRLHGGRGSDDLWGDTGDDLHAGGKGSDGFRDNRGVDMVDLRAGIATGVGDDTLRSIENVHVFAASASVFGNSRPNTLELVDASGILKGRGEDDVLIVSGFGFELLGGPGDDVMQTVSGSATYDGGPGVDKLDFIGFGPFTIDLQDPDFASIEWILGSSSGDSLTGDDFANVILGRGGNDSISGEGGDDRLGGGPGTNSIDGGDGVDHCVNPTPAEGATSCESPEAFRLPD